VNASSVANNSITSASIVDGSVSLADLSANSVDSSKIVDGSVNNSDLADGSITDSKITGPISGSKISGNLSVGDIIADDSVQARLFTGDVFNGGTFKGSFVGDGSGITNLNVANINNGTLNNLLLNNPFLENPTVNGSLSFGSDFLLQTLSVNGSVNAPLFNGSTMRADSFIGGSFTGDGAGLTNVNASSVANNSITSASIVDGSVSLADLSANSVDSSKIVDASITGSDIANNTIENSKIISIDAEKITGILPTNSIPNDLNLNSLKTNIQVYLPNTIEVNSNSGITTTQLTSTVLKIKGENGPIDIAPGIKQIASEGMNEGQMLILKGRADMGTNTVTFNTGDGLILSQGVDFTMGKDDVLILILVDNNWIEISRTDN
jgi:hypothetical protein